MKIALTIAGSDSGGGAGIQADLKTFQELKVFGCSVITAITAQNTQTVSSIQAISSDVVIAQFKAILEDFTISSIKTGMLYSTEIIMSIAPILSTVSIPLVVDPVMISKSGANLLNKKAISAFRRYILPLTDILTPNIPEAETLTNKNIRNEQDIVRSADYLQYLGVQHVLIKGGHSTQKTVAQDYLFTNSKRYRLSTSRINTLHTHGTGCTFSAAISALLAQEYSLLEAVIEAKKFIQMAIENPINIGHGQGPVNHFAYQDILPKVEIIIEEF